MTICNTRYYHIYRRRVPWPSAEIYSLISENFRIVCTNKIEKPSVGVTLPPLGVEAGTTAVLRSPRVPEGWLVLNETPVAPKLQMRGLCSISVARRDVRGPDNSLKRAWIFIYTCL